MNRLASQKALPRIELKVHFRNGHRGRRQLRRGENQKQAEDKQQDLPRLTRLLALAHRWNRLIEEGVVANYAEIARMMGVSRARVTQIMGLLYLAPGIQEEILLPSNDSWSSFHMRERGMRQICQIQNWTEQNRLWRRLKDKRSKYLDE